MPRTNPTNHSHACPSRSHAPSCVHCPPCFSRRRRKQVVPISHVTDRHVTLQSSSSSSSSALMSFFSPVFASLMCSRLWFTVPATCVRACVCTRDCTYMCTCTYMYKMCRRLWLTVPATCVCECPCVGICACTSTWNSCAEDTPIRRSISLISFLIFFMASFRRVNGLHVYVYAYVCVRGLHVYAYGYARVREEIQHTAVLIHVLDASVTYTYAGTWCQSYSPRARRIAI